MKLKCRNCEMFREEDIEIKNPNYNGNPFYSNEYIYVKGVKCGWTGDEARNENELNRKCRKV